MPSPRGTKACDTCRQMKVLCDYQKPQCLRCLRYGVRCDGYDRDTVFVNRDASNIQKGARAVRSRASNRTHGKQPSLSKCSDDPSSSAAPSISCGSTPNNPDNAPLPTLEQTLEIAVRDATATAALDDAWVLKATSAIRGPVLQLVKDYFATEGPVWLAPKLYAAIMKSVGSSAMYDCAVSATALIRGGQVHGNENLVYQGTYQYQKALGGLQVALRHPKTRQHDLTLAVCTAICVYEMLAKTQKSMDPWINHLKGMGHIIRLRGPEASQLGISHQIFLYYRQNASTLAVLTRKSSFLSDPEWLEIPFQQQPREIFQHFLDLIFKFASVLETNDKAKLSSPPNDRLRGQIAADCEGLRAAFVNWHETFIQQFPNRQYYAEMPSYSIVAEDYYSGKPVFTSYLQFSALAVPSAIMTYWAMSIYLTITAQFNLRAINPVADTFCTNYAFLIARSVPYCLQDEFRTSRLLVLIYPLRVAMQWFKHIGKEREVRWCEQVFRRAVRGGDPFRDPEPEGGDEGEGEGRGGGSVYQLALARFGADCLRLEFFTPAGGTSLSELGDQRKSST